MENPIEMEDFFWGGLPPLFSEGHPYLTVFIGKDLQKSGQIIATSHDLTPNGGLVREIPLFQENPGW